MHIHGEQRSLWLCKADLTISIDTKIAAIPYVDALAPLVGSTVVKAGWPAGGSSPPDAGQERDGATHQRDRTEDTVDRARLRHAEPLSSSCLPNHRCFSNGKLRPIA